MKSIPSLQKNNQVLTDRIFRIAKDIANYKKQYNILNPPTMTNPQMTDLYIDGDFVVAIVNEFLKYTISLAKLEKWLENSNLLEWISDEQINGEHKQDSGTMTFMEWFESNYVSEDVFKAIEVFELKPEQI
jgi:hypothetical protein